MKITIILLLAFIGLTTSKTLFQVIFLTEIFIIEANDGQPLKVTKKDGKETYDELLAVMGYASPDYYVFTIWVADGVMASVDYDGSTNIDMAVFLGKTLDYKGPDDMRKECLLWKASDAWDLTTEAMLKANIDKMKYKFISIIDEDKLSFLE
jgi:hypothetical protein